MTKRPMLLSALLFGGALLAHAGQINLTLINAPGIGTVIPDFSTLGTNGASIASPASGVGYTISTANGANFTVMEQGVGWSGNFSYGDALLWNGGNGPDTIVFSSPIQSVGFKLQNNYYGTFTGYLDVYDLNDFHLGQVSSVGLSSGDGDNSVMFIGVTSDLANISKVVISTDGSEGTIGANDFALGSGSFTLSTPEPGTGTLVAGLLLLGLASRRRHRA